MLSPYSHNKCCQFQPPISMHPAPGDATNQRVQSVSQSGTRWPIVLLNCQISGSPQRGPNAPWNPMNAPPVKAVDVYVSPNEIAGKLLLRPKFLLIGNMAVDWPLCSALDWSGLSVRVIHWAWHQ